MYFEEPHQGGTLGVPAITFSGTVIRICDSIRCTALEKEQQQVWCGIHSICGEAWAGPCSSWAEVEVVWNESTLEGVHDGALQP